MRHLLGFSMLSLLSLSACSGDGGGAAPGDAGVSGVRDAGPVCPTEGGALQPAPRGDSAGGVDPMTGQLWVFGGDVGPTVNCRLDAMFRADTWRFDPVCDRWYEVASTEAPSARSRAAYAVDPRRRTLYLFGGRFRAGSTGNYTNYNDLWALDFSTGQWRRVETQGAAPSARSNAAAAFDADGDALYIVGGNTSVSGLTFAPQGDVWRLSLGDLQWSRVEASGPRPRLFHAAAVQGGALWIYGGGGANAFTGPFFGDAWRLDLRGDAGWSEVALSGDVLPLGRRINAGLVPGADQVLVIAGHDDEDLGNRNDVHGIGASGAVRLITVGDTLNRRGSGFCSFPPDFAQSDLEAPERRSAFVIAPDPARQRALVFGGKTDCGSSSDVWAVSLDTGRWSPVRATNDGLSCARTGRTGCTSLCQ